MLRNNIYKKFVRGVGISTAPLLNINQLWKSNKNCKKNSSIYHRIKSFYKDQNIHWTTSSTESLKLIIRFISKKKKGKVVLLFPSYYCNEVLEGINKLCNFEFYDITDSFYSIKNKLESTHIDALIICNYFGGEENNILINNIKKSFNGIIIYDNAHSQVPNISLLIENEFILMSLYKHYPIREGACLIYSKKLNLKNNKKISKNKLYFGFKNIFLDFLFIFKKIVSEIFPNISRVELLRNNPFEKSYPIKYSNHNEPNISIISKLIIKSSICNYQIVSDLNKYSRNLMLKLLLWIGIKKTDLISKGYGIEILLRDEYIKVLDILNKSGLPIFRWPTLNESIKKTDLYQNTFNLWNEKLYIICNSSISDAKINHLKKRLINKSYKIYTFHKITELDYSAIHYQSDYFSYLQSASYIKCYTKIYYFYKINIGEKNIGKFAVCIKRKYGIKLIILNRIKLKTNEYHLSNFEINCVYKQLIEFIKKEFSRGILILLTMESNNLGNFVNYNFNRLFKFNPYKTGLLDLTKSLEILNKNMKGRWRNALKNGLKLKINTKIYTDQKNLFKIFDLYDNEKKKKKYKGIKTSLLKEWFSKSKTKDLKLIAFNACKTFEGQEQLLGSIVICIHHSTATYLLAVNKKYKETKYVSNILLWESIVYSKNYGCSFFDLGGIDSIKTPGVALFKLGLNPELHIDGNFLLNLT